MSQENVEIVRRIYSGWAEGDSRSARAFGAQRDPGDRPRHSRRGRSVRWSGGRQGLHDQFPGLDS